MSTSATATGISHQAGRLSWTSIAVSFANGVAPPTAAVLAAVQRPAALAQLFEPSGPPAWKTIPAWSLIGSLDNAVPPALQEAM